MAFKKDGEIKVFKKRKRNDGKVTADFTGERFKIDDLVESFDNNEDKSNDDKDKKKEDVSN